MAIVPLICLAALQGCRKLRKLSTEKRPPPTHVYFVHIVRKRARLRPISVDFQGPFAHARWRKWSCGVGDPLKDITRTRAATLHESTIPPQDHAKPLPSPFKPFSSILEGELQKYRLPRRRAVSCELCRGGCSGRRFSRRSNFCH